MMADIVRLYALDPQGNESVTKQNAGYSEHTTLLSHSKDGQFRDLGGPVSFLSEPSRPENMESNSGRDERSQVISGRHDLRLLPIVS